MPDIKTILRILASIFLVILMLYLLSTFGIWNELKGKNDYLKLVLCALGGVAVMEGLRMFLKKKSG
ncbi:MAG: hypothetical protein HQK83_03745 [Fibrobacteria bacterium]|nr:hypothetical protein [Fibrobacteria bacterium]